MARLKKVLDFIKDPILIVLVCLLIFQFIGARTRVPSGSMEPTIHIGDHLLISRIPTYYRSPEIGEIVVFWEDNTSMIKRVVAGPLDEVDLRNGDLYVNGKLVDDSQYVKALHESRPIIYSSLTFPLTVPEGHYFVMGDNRGDSEDSRYFGPISEKAIRAIGAYRIGPFENRGFLE